MNRTAWFVLCILTVNKLLTNSLCCGLNCNALCWISLWNKYITGTFFYDNVRWYLTGKPECSVLSMCLRESFFHSIFWSTIIFRTQRPKYLMIISENTRAEAICWQVNWQNIGQLIQCLDRLCSAHCSYLWVCVWTDGNKWSLKLLGEKSWC